MAERGVKHVLAAIAAGAALLWAAAAVAESCEGCSCSCRCGPGFRLPNGKCASWAQHRRYTARGGYPDGTVDELPQAKQPANCPAELIRLRRAGGGSEKED